MLSLIGAGRTLEGRIDAALGTVGLSLPKYGVLSALARARHPLPLSELADCQRCVRSNITQLVDRLEADGFVRRIDDPVDRRIVRAELTELGRERLTAGTAKLGEVQAEFLAAFPQGDRKTLERLLAALE